jgi:hypothetical protein
LHKKQLLTYIELSNKKLRILVNFNASKLIDIETGTRQISVIDKINDDLKIWFSFHQECCVLAILVADLMICFLGDH